MTLKKLHCLWAPENDEIYRQYHDEEWGVPEYDDRALFEKLILDGFQAGLSWRTILYKRDNFRKAFDGFNPGKIVRYTPKKIDRLMNDAGIIRSKTKINATIGNAKAYLEIMEAGDGAFSDFLWDFVDGAPIALDAGGLPAWRPAEAGFYQVSAVDRAGRSSAVRVRVIGAGG